MTVGYQKNKQIADSGVVTYDAPTAGTYDFLFEAPSTTKPSGFNLGDRVGLPDGRAFRLAKASGTVQPETCAFNNIKSTTNAVAPAQATGAGTVGSALVTFTVAAGDGVAADGVVAADELRGGYIVIGNGNAQHPQMRQIIGNTAVASGGGSCTATLDVPLDTAPTVATTNIEAYTNPYANLSVGSLDYASAMGVPTRTATTGQYFWAQTWGPCWLTSNGATCDSARDRTIVVVGNGSVESSNDETLENGFQAIGYAVDASGSGSANGPLVMLQLAP